MVGALLSRGELMALVSRRRLGRNGILFYSCYFLFREWKETLLLEGCLEWGRGLFFFLSYPFALAANKEVSIADVWEPSREGGVWTPCFVKPFNDWEVEEIQNLFQAIQDKRILSNQDDLMLTREARDECFSVKLLYKVLVGSNLIVFLHQLIWSNWVPTKMVFFLLGKLLGASC